MAGEMYLVFYQITVELDTEGTLLRFQRIFLWTVPLAGFPIQCSFLTSLEFTLYHFLCLPMLDLAAQKHFLIFCLQFALFIEMSFQSFILKAYLFHRNECTFHFLVFGIKRRQQSLTFFCRKGYYFSFYHMDVCK